MKRLLLIVLPLFISVGFSQQIIHTETYDNGNIKSITYHKKTRYGIEKVKEEGYYPYGQKYSEGTYKDGRQDGVWTWWYEDGKKIGEGSYLNGDGTDLGYRGVPRYGRDGKWTFWYENGQKYTEGTYKNGEYISPKYWNEDGSVME